MATKAAAYWRKCCRDPSAWDFLSLAQLRPVVSSRPSAKKYAHGEPPSQKKKIGRDFQCPSSKKKPELRTSRPHIKDLFPPLSRTKVPSSTHQAAHIHWWHIRHLRLKTNLRDLKLKYTKVMCWKGKKSSYIAGLCQTHAFQLPVFLATASYRIDLVR